MNDEIPRESKEYISLGFKVDGSIPNTGVEAVLLPHRTRPTESDWTDAELVDDEWCIFLDATVLPLGNYDIWARYTGNPEKPVRYAPRAIRII